MAWALAGPSRGAGKCTPSMVTDQTIGAPTIDKRCSAVHRGVSHDGRFISGGARNQEPDGDTRRRDNDLDRFEPFDRRNTLRHVSLVYCIKYEIYGDALG